MHGDGGLIWKNPNLLVKISRTTVLFAQHSKPFDVYKSLMQTQLWMGVIFPKIVLALKRGVIPCSVDEK